MKTYITILVGLLIFCIIGIGFCLNSLYNISQTLYDVNCYTSTGEVYYHNVLNSNGIDQTGHRIRLDNCIWVEIQ